MEQITTHAGECKKFSHSVVIWWHNATPAEGSFAARAGVARVVGPRGHRTECYAPKASSRKRRTGTTVLGEDGR